MMVYFLHSELGWNTVHPHLTVIPFCPLVSLKFSPTSATAHDLAGMRAN